MDQLLEVLFISSDSEEIDERLLSEAVIRSLSPGNVEILCDRCFFILADSSGGRDSHKQRAQKVISSLHLHIPDALESSCIRYAVDLISKDNGLQPSEILNAVKNLLEIPALEPSIAKCISVRITCLIQQCDSSLLVLTQIANVAHDHPACLPPMGQQLKFILEIINRIASLDVPKIATDIMAFVRNVTTVASMVERIWMTSSTEVVLSCLSVVYTLIISSSFDKPPCRTLAAFLQITPVNEIDVALDQLLNKNRQSNDTHVKILASVLCDWLIEWPKATKLPHWIISLFKMLTLKGKSYIVADIILQKAAQLMERSWLPVIHNVTSSVLRYMLLTYRHSEEVLHLLTGPAVNAFSKLSPHDVTAKNFRSELGEVFHLLIEHFPNSKEQCRSLLSLMSDIPKPNDERVKKLISSVPVLFASIEKSTGDGDCSAVVVGSNHRWLQCRSATGRVGLINLGNTCYINCILQSLCMNQDFTRAILEAVPSPHQVLLVKLQTVMAFLLYSFRSAYSPAAFIKASRPLGFEAGRQQDCTEFLRHLLDTMYEQEKMDRDVVHVSTERWTVHGNSVAKQEMVEEDESQDEDESHNGSISEGKEMQLSDGVMKAGGLQRWITEEDLTTPNHLTAEDEDDQASEGKLAPQAGKDAPTAINTEKIYPDSSLSNLHSESTDSGIQSVGDGPSCNLSESGQMEREKDRSDGSESSKPRSLVHRIFGGKLTTSHLCLECRTESVQQSFFTDIYLPFPQVSDPKSEFALESLLDSVFSTEKMEGENRYNCEKCNGYHEAERTTTITEAPNHLLLTLLRFEYDNLRQRHTKSTARVTYSQQLELKMNGKRAETYELYAVVIHSGFTLDSGHYYTFARSSQAMSQDSWFVFNDSQVTATDFQTLVDLSKNHPTDTPYLLWYKRVVNDVPGEFTPSPCPSLRSDLKEQVDRDNLKFMQEREQDWWSKRNTINNRNDRDDGDRDDHFHHNDQVPRFVC